MPTQVEHPINMLSEQEFVSTSLTYPERQNISVREESWSHSSETFCVSSVKTDIPSYQNHLQRFLNCTNLRYLYWINLNHSEVQFRTLHA